MENKNREQTVHDPAMNEAQNAAISHDTGPALVLAGPGSGKTYTIVKRLENLIPNCDIEPSSILTLTYTNQAAREMKSRALSMIGGRARGTTFGTFHSVFYSILKSSFSLNSSNILKPSDKYMILSDIARGLRIDSQDMRSLADELSAIISRNKNGMDMKSGFTDEENEKICSLYKERLRELRLIDFDDMIIKCRALFEKDEGMLKRWRERYRYIQIDEFQDINESQYDVVRQLAGADCNIFAVGDDDQSIYGFRGASPGIMQKFLKDYPKARVYSLEVNYRCSAPIAYASDRLIAENKNRIEKHHVSFNQTGDEPDVRCFKDRTKEIEAICEKIDKAHIEDYAVLLRTNELRDYFAEELERREISVKSLGKRKSIYDSDMAKDLISYLRLASGAFHREDLLRVLNKPMRYLSREAFASENAKPEDAMAYYKGAFRLYDEACRFAEDIRMMGKMKPKAAVRYLMNVVGYEKFLKGEGRSTDELYMLYDKAGHYSSIGQWLKEIENETASAGNGASAENENKSGITVMTLHASKGLEFREVFICDVNEGIIPYHKAKLTEDIEEERRLLYVGMTRAIRKLHLFYIEESFGKELMPSSFLDDGL